MTRIAVIGAGITGVTTASSLMDRGYEVTLFDRNRYAAMQTSFANGGQLSASNAEIWNRWSTVFKGMKWMMTRGAPLLVNPKPSWHKYSWMAEFVASIPQYRANTVQTTRMAIAARGLLKEKAARHGFDFDCEDRGILHIFTDKAEFDHATEVNRLLAEGGLRRRAVTPVEMRAIEPALSGTFHGGYYVESDFTGDIHRYTTGLARAIEAQGAQLRFGTDVEAIRVDRNAVNITSSRNHESMTEAFDAIVVCAGVESRAFGAQLRDRVNVYPVKGYSITVRLDDEESQRAAPWISLLDDQAKVVTSRLGKDRFRIAGTAEFNGYNLDIRDDRIRPLVKWCERFFPGVSTEHAIPWAGLRPMMPNMMPKVGQGRRERVFYNTGHGHLGWTLSAVTAEMVAETVAASRTVNGAAAVRGATPPAQRAAA
ncbi:D-amino acid dehydrogenase [Meridianimarinicoccus roseus]|uniref:D-amino acid dehydrogenase n=1 Tax=Meridianimarinicoccus roseus TaxID=2072018 RepID=A0A2V2LKZ0_9RHOB|nr:D-amino acid dehydrogenase [Meridianimarinicoccus roseus]PWR02463.1 D-amino acid dehydrogenase [Meridianimarinicoccus roseus]